MKTNKMKVVDCRFDNEPTWYNSEKRDFTDAHWAICNNFGNSSADDNTIPKMEGVADSNKVESEIIDDFPQNLLTDDAIRAAVNRKVDNKTEHIEEDKPKSKGKISLHKLAELLSEMYPIALFENEPYVYVEETRAYRPLVLNGNFSELLNLVPEQHKDVVNHYTVVDIIAWIRVQKKVHVVDTAEVKTRGKSMVNFKNSAIWVNSLTPAFAGKNQYFRRYINVNYPLDYQPEGQYFEKYLDKTFGDDVQAKRLFQEVVGYILGDYRGAKKAFLFYGPSNTGKTVAGNFLRKIVGEEFTSAMTLSDLNQRFGPAKLFGKFLNIGSEIDTASRASGSLFKRLVGNDEIAADIKHLYGIDYVNTAAMVFLANSFPRFSVGENAGSIAERFIIVPFLNSVAREDWIPDLDEKIFAEGDYVVKFAMEGLRRLQNNNYQFSYCKTSERLLSEYLIQAFPENQFVKKLLVADPEGKVATAELDSLYRSFCAHYDLPCPGRVSWYPILSEEFNVKRTRGINYKENHDARGFSGISFK